MSPTQFLDNPIPQGPRLHEKHAAYESLSNQLTQLPRKLTHPGLIPIAPRLYLPGELIRTNEILVLLGRSGEVSYFAERTAWQAHDIVRRRLGHVEQGLQELLAGVGEVNVTERPSSTRKKRVTFREPVVCASPPLKSRPRPSITSGAHASPNDKCGRDKEASTEAADSVTNGNARPGRDSNFSLAQENPVVLQSSKDLASGKADGSQNVNHLYDPVVGFPQEYMDVLRAAELDEDSSDDDIEGTYVDSVGEDNAQVYSKPSDTKDVSKLSKPLKQLHESKTGNVSSLGSAQNYSVDTEPGDEPRDDKQNSAREGDKVSERHSVSLDFQDALLRAERQAREDGVVNLMEFYEDGSGLPSRVTLPPHFEPDETIDFDGDSAEYLDMTGESAKDTRTPVPRNHLEFLRDEARKEEEEERRKTTKMDLSEFDRRIEKLEKEKKEFGTGLAKGFFGTPSKGNSVSKEQDVHEPPAPYITNPEASELQETGAVEERVVERKISRRSSRRHRRPRATVIPEVMNVAVSQQYPEVGEDERTGQFTRIEDLPEKEDSQMSKFRQLQKLKRVSTDGATHR